MGVKRTLEKKIIDKMQYQHESSLAQMCQFKSDQTVKVKKDTSGLLLINAELIISTENVAASGAISLAALLRIPSGNKSVRFVSICATTCRCSQR